MEKFARVCDISGKGMNEGYCFNDGEFYCATEELAKQHVESLGYNWEEEKETIDTEDEWFYWTEWEVEEEEEWYDEDGTLFCKPETLQLIYTIHNGIPDDYTTTRNNLTARKIYLKKAQELGVKFETETSHLGVDELENIIRQQLEWTEKEIRWESVNLI